MVLNSCDQVTVYVVVDAYVDMLSGSKEGVKRLGLDFHFHPANKPVKADGGACLVVDVFKGDRRKRILIDGGYCGDVALHNMKLLGIDPATIDVAILSHGHPDHFTGMPEVLAAIGHSVPLYVHPDAFLPRSIMPEGGFSMDYINRELTPEKLEAAGAKIIPMTSPVQLAPGFLYTGQIERTVDFEKEVPKGRFCLRDGCLEPDDICDDTGFICNIRDEGLLVASMCGHSGIVNTVRYSQKLTGVDRIFGVIGGFHLGHPGVSKEKINTTIQEMKDMKIKLLAPFHCSGMVTRHVAAEMLPEAFVSIGAATVLEL
jgi:7,8-dihydropterin-6-yl-methyl-4-(beta-D-ribofuranosyl)aminobenzene 5'-phosphate synthase